MRRSFCLNSTVDCKQISESPLNRSSSKNLWSFGKDSRFKAPKVYCDSIYNTPSTFRQKGPAIGYGTKMDWTNDHTCSPGSSKYNLKTIFDQNARAKKGFSISLSREKIPSRGHIPLEPLKNPAPNQYNNLKLNPGQRYSMRLKTKVMDPTMSIESQNNNPGAGRYQNPEALSPRGSYAISKHRGTGASLFNPQSSIRFFQFKDTVPGPGAYKQVNLLSDRGHYPLSSTNGFGKRLFDKETRVVQFEKKSMKNYVPGPGSYRSPSEFGHYDGDIYKHMHMDQSASKSSFSRNNSQNRLNKSTLNSSTKKLV